MERKKPKYQIIDGVARCVLLNPDIFRENLKFKAKAGDVVQSAFPKSGTHWVQFIIQLILRKGEPITTRKEFADNRRILEYTRCQDWMPALPLRTFVSHLPLHRDIMTEEAKYVYVARNPWDVCVSFFYFATNSSVYDFHDGTFEALVEAFIDAQLGYGDYFEHVASGYALRKEPNVFFVTYEELKEQKRSVVLKLAHFLGEEYGKDLEDNKELLISLLERSTAESMRSIFNTDIHGDVSEGLKEMLSRNKYPRKAGYGGDVKRAEIVRAAEVGEWRKHFTPELLHQMEFKIREAEKKSSFMELWHDIRVETIQASKYPV